MADFITDSAGRPKYTNQLKDSSSPYLRQHAHNPVDWYPWGKTALARAKKENKPILLSIGYSTCYWCHVMEREVFNDEAIAEQMNRDFINIKVDREERPDLDEIYMMARQLLTREGGWPNNVFLTPELKPFFAGGTFSADRRYGRMSFPEVITALTQSWENKREEVESGGEQVTERLRALLSAPGEPLGENPINREVISQHVEYLKDIFDTQHGGFHHAPKFPNETLLLFLLDYYRQTKDAEVLSVVTKSLDNMAAGGIFDHVGGGFHRYAVDEAWQVPHFEKMLYNQAMMAFVYTRAYHITRKPYYQYIAQSTLDFVLMHMASPEGVFYSAYDAETDAVEGAYYIWTPEEISHLLSPGASKIFFETYGMAPLPQFPGHKHTEGRVLYALKPLDVLATERELTYDEFQEQLDKILGKLLLERENRKPPARDEKIIAAWNGLMIQALAYAGKILEAPQYTAAAERAASFILDHLSDRENNLYRIYHKGKASIPGFLEDYAYFTEALLTLYEVTGKPVWLDRAVDVVNRADDIFLDDRFLTQKQSGFFLTPKGADLIVRIKTADDSALPSANAAMVHCLYDFAHLTRNTNYESDIWERRAFETIAAFAERILSSPQSHTHMLHGRMRLMGLHALAGKTLPHVAADEVHVVTAPESHLSKTPSSAHYLRASAEVKGGHIRAGAPFTLLVKIHVAKGWHINANPAANSLIATSVSLRGPNVDLIKTHYPRPTYLTSKLSDEPLPTYQDEVSIPIDAFLNRSTSAGEIEDLRVTLHIQACNESLCLKPADILLELPMVVSGPGGGR